MDAIRKYPRTPHVIGSRLQPGDEDVRVAAFAEIAGRDVVVEEKLDGANAGISFGPGGEPRLQSRGHYLDGGARERQFDRFKAWARDKAAALFARIGTRYLVYGEWLHAKHTIFYDALPDFFLEFDVLDLDRGLFLTTPDRRDLLAGTGVHSVPVLHQGPIAAPEDLERLVARSRFKSPDWRARLRAAAERPPHRPRFVSAQTDDSDLAEGLYIKLETAGHVAARFKYVRATFRQAVEASGGHWRDRPLLHNELAARP